ncbi:RNA recognition motif-containing protein [Besnoitia besnoiti]|uniref:RNA recognition motif-containing protein n=1 Tax=Besnoitia besnoiti TaxID=94643 RepID=A0A2A9M8A4_BESBE|nr:RNA recognition motif-containing protein [Besnoitia besnoiti]PFH33394.1 RNA recognition motif-containing protein [Besnoitia besnoiti]
MSRSLERGSSSSSGAYQMWLGNIPFDATEEDLKALLSRVGRVIQVRVKYDEGGQSKGFAFCEFPDPETCYLAYVTLNNVDLGGRKLKIDFATDELRQRFGSTGGGAASARAERRKGNPSGAAQQGGEAAEDARAISAAALLGSLQAAAGLAPGESLLGVPCARLGRGRDRHATGGTAAGVSARRAASLAPVALYDGAAAAADIMEILQTFSTSQLLAFLGDIKRLMQESSSACRQLLLAHPAIVYAALHAMYLLAPATAESARAGAETDEGARGGQRSSSLPPPEKRQKLLGGEAAGSQEKAAAFERDVASALERRMGLSVNQLDKARKNRDERVQQLRHAGLSVQFAGPTAQQATGATDPAQSAETGAPALGAQTGQQVGAGAAAPGGSSAPAAALSQPWLGSAAEDPAVPRREGTERAPQLAPPLQTPSAQVGLGLGVSSPPTAVGGGVRSAALPSGAAPGLPPAAHAAAAHGAPSQAVPSSSLPLSAPPAAISRQAPATGARGGAGVQAQQRPSAAPLRKAGEEDSGAQEAPPVPPAGRQAPEAAAAAPAGRESQRPAAAARGAASPGLLQAPAEQPQLPVAHQGAAVPAALAQHPAFAVPPAPDTLVDEVLKSPDILANVLNSKHSTMRSWPPEQRRQVLALQSALLRRGFPVAQ